MRVVVPYAAGGPMDFIARMVGRKMQNVTTLVIDNRHNGRYIIVPASMHKPLQQAIVVTAKGSRATTAKKFTELVGSVKGRDIMRAYGFLLPGDPSPPNSNG